jgi:DNA-binding MarR family transcriptional regulator
MADIQRIAFMRNFSSKGSYGLNALDSRAMPSRPRREPRLPLWSRPGYLIRRLHQIHVALFLEECKAAQLTPVQYGLLTALGVRGELDQGSLAEELGLDRTTAAEVLSRLEARRLVTRKPNPKDRRARLARLTVRGRAVTAGMFAGMQRAQDRLCAPLSQKERDAFMATLVRLIEANNEYGRGILRMD